MSSFESKVKKTIMVVDDSLLVLETVKKALVGKYTVWTIPSAEIMFDLLAYKQPDLIALDIEMPGINGISAIKRLKASPELRDIPVIFLTGKTNAKNELEGLYLGAVDYITKPFTSSLLLQRIENHLTFKSEMKELKENNNSLQEILRERQDNIITLQNTIIDIVADLVGFRDGFTGGHIFRTQRYMEILVREVAKDERYKEEIKDWKHESLIPSVQLHDVGKIAISDAILQKQSQLNDEEYKIMCSHVATGISIISKIESMVGASEFLYHARRITGTHHEKWDGTGYPYKLSGKDIPLEGRLMAIADVYDALVSVRPYKTAVSTEKACAIIREGAGTHFDPALVEHFVKVSREFAEVVKNCICA